MRISDTGIGKDTLRSLGAKVHCSSFFSMISVTLMAFSYFILSMQ